MHNLASSTLQSHIWSPPLYTHIQYLPGAFSLSLSYLPIYPPSYAGLRCGDAAAASRVLETSVQEGHPVRSHVAALALQQGTDDCFWASRPSLKPLVHRYVTSNDPYELACAKLLAGNEVTDEGLMDKLEDHVYVSLWNTVLSTQPDVGVEQLAQKVEALGPHHFEGSHSPTGWPYAKPLLLAQRYEAAFEHLMSHGYEGLLHAAHLSLFWPGLSDDLVSTLLVDFSIKLQFVDASAALAYLIRIPNVQKRRTEVR